MSSKEKLKKYQKEKFKHFKKINELKINDNEAYIELKIDNLKSITSDYSISHDLSLKKEFYDAIERKNSFIPLDFPLVLEIHSANFNAEEKILVRKIIKNHYSLVCIEKEMELKAIKRKSIFFLMCGLLGFVLLLLMYNFNIGFLSYTKEIISFISSFGLWEFAELLLFEQDDLKEEIIKYKHLSKIRVVYNKDNS